MTEIERESKERVSKPYTWRLIFTDRQSLRLTLTNDQLLRPKLRNGQLLHEGQELWRR